MTVIKAAVVTGLPASLNGIATLAITLQMEGVPGSVTVTTDSADSVTIPLVLQQDVSKVTTVTIGTQSHPIDAVNPTSITYPGGRGANQLILYTPAFGLTTKTNKWGVEVPIIDGVIPSKPVSSVGSMTIPANGFVLSGHNIAGQWLAQYATIDAEVIFS